MKKSPCAICPSRLSGTSYFLNDHLGTPQRSVKPDGAVAWQAAYLPFGQAQVMTSTVQSNLLPGQYFDNETGLHYNWHRFYDPTTGRYLSPDPIGLDAGMNLYGYVEGNPVNTVDPEGKFALLGAFLGAGFELAVQAAYKNYQDGCDMFDVNNYDWWDVGASADVGAFAPVR